MRAARQLAERPGAELRAAAVGAEQVPLHGQKPGADAGEAALDRGALRDVQLARQGLGLERQEIGRHGGQHPVGQRPAEPVAVGAAVDLGGERRRPLARAVGQLGRSQVEMGRARALGEGDGLEDALAHDLARLARQPRAEQAAHQGERLPVEGVAHAAATGAIRLEIEHRPEAAERALGEDTGLAEVAAVDPLVGLLLPFERKARRLAAAAAQDRAVGLRRLLQHVGRQPHRLVEAVGVGQHRPELGRRQVEGPGPGAAHDSGTVVGGVADESRGITGWLKTGHRVQPRPKRGFNEARTTGRGRDHNR